MAWHVVMGLMIGGTFGFLFSSALTAAKISDLDEKICELEAARK